MSKATKLNFSTIENSYNSNLNRDESEDGSITNDTGLFSAGFTKNDDNNKKIEATVEDIIKNDNGKVQGHDLENLWISSWIKSRSYLPGKRGFILDGKTGYIECASLKVRGTGEMGGWNIDATRIYSDDDGLILDSSVPSIESGNYVSGYAGAGFHISEDLFETANFAARGLIRTAVFQKDVISSVGGNLMVLDSDVLDADMTALDASTLTTKATTTFSTGDILRIKDGTDDEWLEVTAVNGVVYTVTRDKDSDYTADTNPAWKKGATIVNYGQSGDGGIFMTASESNAPYLSVFTHAGSPWLTSGAGCKTERLRIGNLNGYLGYSSDLYGIGIGDTNNYIKYDTTDGIQLKVTGSNAITIDSGSDILLTEGGDIKFTIVTKPTACTVALVEIAGNIDAGTHSYKIVYVNDHGETQLGNTSNVVTNDGTHEQNSLTSIPISSSSSVIARKIYRTKAGGLTYHYLATISDNTTTIYTDNIADASLTTGSANTKQNDSFGKIFMDTHQVISINQSTLVGYEAGKDITSGNSNTLIGGYSGYKVTEGNENVLLGYGAGSQLTTGDSNVFIGRSAGYGVVTGNKNVMIGYAVGQYETSSNKLYIDNSNTTTPLIYGDFDYNNIGFNLKSFGGGRGVISIANVTVNPTTNPSGGGILYCRFGALMYRGSSGTITTIANA